MRGRGNAKAKISRQLERSMDKAVLVFICYKCVAFIAIIFIFPTIFTDVNRMKTLQQSTDS